MRGREDEWMLKERGEAALDYLNFERMLIVVSLIINGLSLVSLIVNEGGGQVAKTMASERYMGDMWHHHHYLTPFVNSTSMWNLEEESLWHFYHVIASFLLPYLVLITAYLFLPTCLTADDNPPSRWATWDFEQICISISSTLVIRGLDCQDHTPMVIRSYFQQMHPHVTIRWLKQQTINLHLGFSPGGFFKKVKKNQEGHLGEGHSQAEEASLEARLCPG